MCLFLIKFKTAFSAELSKSSIYFLSPPPIKSKIFTPDMFMVAGGLDRNCWFVEFCLIILFSAIPPEIFSIIRITTNRNPADIIHGNFMQTK